MKRKEKSSSSIDWISQCWRERTVSCTPVTSLYQHLPLPTSSWAKKRVRFNTGWGHNGQRSWRQITKMSVLLSIFITSSRQGNHSSNTGITIKFPYLWLLMQRTKIFAQSKTRLKKSIFGCTNRGAQEGTNPNGRKEQNGSDAALF